jgi:hypothetical protein
MVPYHEAWDPFLTKRYGTHHAHLKAVLAIQVCMLPLPLAVRSEKVQCSEGTTFPLP